MIAHPAPVPDSPPEAPGISRRAWWTAVIYIAAAAMVLRFYELPVKPLHHDEGVNTLLLTRLAQPPHVYQYDPANYHGPTLYYFGWLSAATLGLTTVAIRSVTAVAGFTAVLLVLFLRRHIGSAGALSAAALLALSPGAVYFSRYFIHEILLVCFTLGAVAAAARWLERGKRAYAHLAALCAGLMFATKETAVISAVVLVAASIGAVLLTGTRSLAWSAAAALVARRLRAGTRPSRRSLLTLLAVVMIFAGVAVIFYTSLFTRWQGVLDAVRTFAFWTRTGSMAHPHPWHTYLSWLWAEESPLLLLGAGGIVFALWRRDNGFAVFAALWALGTFAAYSVIRYKTPWLALNVIAPLAIAGGYACESIGRHRRGLPRGLLAGAAIVAAVVAAYQAIVLSFFQYDNERYPYVYAHTSREVLGLVEKVRELEADNPRSPIAITSRDHFPLSWYFREYPVGYYGRVVAMRDPLVIGSADQQETLDGSLGSTYRRLGAYRLRPGVRLVLYARRDLRQ